MATANPDRANPPAPEPPAPRGENDIGMREEDWPTTPEGLAELLARMDARAPVEPESEEERLEWEAIRKERREYEKANFFRWVDRVVGEVE